MTVLRCNLPTYRGKLAPKGPYEIEKHVPEKLYMRENAPIYIQCTWYMLGTNAATRMASQEAVQDQNKHKCCICCVFVIVFFSVSKSGNMNNWHVQGADPTGRQPVRW